MSMLNRVVAGRFFHAAAHMTLISWLIIGYESNPGFLGCICGRVANRIDGATFELDGTRYNVSKNDPLGNNMCHGGFKGFSRVRIT